MQKLRGIALIGGLMAGANAQAHTADVFIPRANLQWMNSYVAQGAGLFEEEGLTAETLTGRDGSWSGSDVGVLPQPTYLSLSAQRQSVLAMANLMANDEIGLVARRDVAAQRGLAADPALPERLEALRNRKVAVPSGPRPRLRCLLDATGLDADRHGETAAFPGPQQNETFGSGRVNATCSHTPFRETAIADEEANPLRGTATLMGRSAATAGPILKTAKRLAAEMTPVVQPEQQQDPPQPPPTFTENVTVVSSAPMITKRSWFKITVGSALTAASVFVPNDTDPAKKWTARFALSVAGGALTHWLGEVPDNDRMGREYVVAIAACMQLSNLDISTFNPELLTMYCPGVSTPQTQEAQDIGTESVERAYRNATDSTEDKSGFQTRAERDEASRWLQQAARPDELRARFVEELRAAADNLIR